MWDTNDKAPVTVISFDSAEQYKLHLSLKHFIIGLFVAVRFWSSS